MNFGNSREDDPVSYVDRVAKVLLDRSAWVYGRLVAGQRHGVHLQEETITEDLLLDIAMELPEITLKQFTRKEESRNGADWQWEWWFRGERWFGVRLQAKRLRVERNGRQTYGLTYRIGGDGELQARVLREQAREDQIAAAYVFYNGPELDLNSFPWGCGQLEPRGEHFGVSVLPAVVAVQLVQENAFDVRSVARASRPWPCLIRCDPGFFCHHRYPFYPASPSTPFDEAVARNFFGTVIDSPNPNQYQRDPAGYIRTSINTYCREQPPEYMTRLAEGDFEISNLLRPSVNAVTLFTYESNVE